MTAEQDVTVDAADEALDLWVRAAAEQINAAAAKRRRRRRVAVALVVCAGAGIVAGRASAGPRPDPAPPLRYTRAQIENVLPSWSEWVLATPDADGLTWAPFGATCATRRRCNIAGGWWSGDDYTPMVYRLRRCFASRRVWESDLARTRKGWVARVLVDRRGGLICRLVRPRYIPAGGAS